jgi:anti-anti-sigma regulatory factor
MMEYNKQTKDGRVILQLSGELAISQGDGLRSVLIELLSQTDSVEIDVSSATEVDVACLQLFCASHKTAAKLGKRVCFVNRWSDPFAETVRESGFVRGVGCSVNTENECLWMKEPTQ